MFQMATRVPTFPTGLLNLFLANLLFFQGLIMRKETPTRSKLKRKPSRRKRYSRRKSQLDFQQLEVKRLLAADVPAFSADAGLYQVFSNYGQVGEVNLENQTFETTAFNAGTKVNAAGFRTADNYAYGVVTSINQVARIGSNGEIELLGSVEGLPTNKGTYFVGDFANDDLLYLRNSGQKGILYGVNVDTLKIDNIVETSTPLNNIYDIAFSNVDEKFYASQRGAQNVLISIGLDGEVVTIGNNGVGKLTFGAMYADADGNIFGGANQTGDVYRFNTATGEATVVGHGPKSGTNDGFSNAAAVLEMAPLANDDVVTMDSILTASGSLFADNGNGSDIDPNDDSFVVSAINGDASAVGTTVQLDSGSTLSVGANGQFIYKPSAEYTFLEVGETVTDTAQYTVTDSSDRSSTGTFTVHIEGTMKASEFGDIRVKGLNSFGGPAYAQLGNIGDINGDGFTDGAVSLPSAKGGKGATFVVYGTANGIEQDFDLNRLRLFNGNDGSLGTIFYGIAANDLSGSDFSAAGDINGDGIGDFLIGAKDADANGVRNSGQTYALFGRQEGFGPADADANRKNSGQTFVVLGNRRFDAELNLETLRTSSGGDGSQGVVFNGVRKHDLAGGNVTGGEDLNMDGIADILITAYNADPNHNIDAGQSYVIYGSSNGLGSEFELSSLLVENNGDGTQGLAINGSARSSHEGSFVEISDYDGDGITDLLFGIGNKNATSSGVLFGGTNAFGEEINLSDLDRSPVFLDNFDNATDYDLRTWCALPYSGTLHSANGTHVSIWGDPHVVISIGGVVERFDIGYGAGHIEVIGGAVISWNTYEPDDPRFPLGPPLKSFSVTSVDSLFDVSVSTEDGINSVGNLTSLDESQLLDFAQQLRLFEGDASSPLARKVT